MCFVQNLYGTAKQSPLYSCICSRKKLDGTLYNSGFRILPLHGIEILEIYEVLAHFELSTSLKKPFQFLAGKKCTTTFPTTITKEEKVHKCGEICKTNNCIYLSQYVAKVNENFSELPIKKEDIHENKAAREYYKLMMNSEIGKFTQNNLERTKTTLVKKASETVQLLNNQQLNISIYHLMPDAETLFVQYHTDGAFELADRKFSCILGAFVTAHARVLLHKAIDCVDLKNGIVAYTDTDSLYYIQQIIMRYLINNIHDTKLGDWKNPHSVKIKT